MARERRGAWSHPHAGSTDPNPRSRSCDDAVHRTRPTPSSPTCVPVRRPSTNPWPAPVRLALARQRLADSQRAYATGDTAQATTLALSAYLDGVEPIGADAGRARHAALTARDRNRHGPLPQPTGPPLGPGGYRRTGDADQHALFDRAEAVLQNTHTDTTTAFLGSFTILVREGLGGVADRDRHDRVPAQGRAPRGAALCACWLDRCLAGRRGDVGGGNLSCRHQRRQPRSDRRRVGAVRRRGTPERGHLDAPEELGRPLAAISAREAVGGAVAALGNLPVRAGVRGGVSRGVRDDPVLHRDVERTGFRRHPRGLGDRQRGPGRSGVLDAAHEQALCRSAGSSRSVLS